MFKDADIIGIFTAIALLAGADQVVLCLVGAKQQKMTANAATVKMVQAAIQ